MRLRSIGSVVLLVSLCAFSAVGLAQVDFSGEWDHPGLFGHEDLNDRGQGPEVGDYLEAIPSPGLRHCEWPQ